MTKKERKSASEIEQTPENKITFNAFFAMKMKLDPKLRPDKRNELKTFFKKQGLSEKEELDKYQRLYKKY